MISYIIRRIAYAFPILLGVNLITFMLFFVINSPDDMARLHLGVKHVTQESINNWKEERGYDKPLFYNTEKDTVGIAVLTDTIFFEKSLRLFALQFGRSDSGRDISYDIRQRFLPSLIIAIPIFIIGLLANITFALLIAFFRATYVDVWGVVLCVLLMSISTLFYIIGGQYLIAKVLSILPVSGFQIDGLATLKFVILPVLIGIVGGIGSGTRWYRTIFLEEMGREYVRTARSKGLSESYVLFRHVLRNAMLPILTGVVAVIPLLFMGSLILEAFFGIPGLGSYTIDAIQQQDFAIVRAMVFLGSVLYIFGLILTDISYTLVDPRIRLN